MMSHDLCVSMLAVKEIEQVYVSLKLASIILIKVIEHMEDEMDYSRLCLKCMHEKQNANDKCEYCGFDKNSYVPKQNTISIPSILKGRYLVGIPLGIGGFGITYIAFDLEVGGVCAIKEYMPDTVAFRNGFEQNVSVSESKFDSYQFGMNRFIEEAQMLMKFSQSKYIINVFECFQENNTAYYVMEYFNGCDLRTFTNNFKNKMDFHFGLNCMCQVMCGLEELHNQGVLHRDISPDNIYISKNGYIKILDFGAARYSVTQKERNLSVIIKMGYAPLEQYGTKVSQGPWTDIYALGATFYQLFSGIQLPEATERIMGETVKDLKDYNEQIPDSFSKVIKKAIALQQNERYQSIAGMRKDLVMNLIRDNHVNDFRKATDERIEEESEIIEKSVNRERITFSEAVSVKNVFRRRIAAYMIDFIVTLVTASGLILLNMAILTSMNMLDGVGIPIIWFIAFLTPLFVTLINSALESSKWQGTLGKKITGILTVSSYGNILSIQESIKRNFIKLLGFFLLLTEKNGRYLHEIKSNSKVVCK